jgi:hypothetical protein
MGGELRRPDLSDDLADRGEVHSLGVQKFLDELLDD